MELGNELSRCRAAAESLVARCGKMEGQAYRPSLRLLLGEATVAAEGLVKALKAAEKDLKRKGAIHRR